MKKETSLFIFGVNFEEADAEEMTAFAEEVDELIKPFSKYCQFKLHTSCRTEYYFLENIKEIEAFVTSITFTSVSPEQTYCYSKNEALQHLVLVCLGMKSIKIGETMIKNQVENATDTAIELYQNDDIKKTKEIAFTMEKKTRSRFKVIQHPSTYIGQVFSILKDRYRKDTKIKFDSSSDSAVTLCTKFVEHKYYNLSINKKLEQRLEERIVKRISPKDRKPALVIITEDPDKYYYNTKADTIVDLDKKSECPSDDVRVLDFNEVEKVMEYHRVLSFMSYRKISDYVLDLIREYSGE